MDEGAGLAAVAGVDVRLAVARAVFEGERAEDVLGADVEMAQAIPRGDHTGGELDGGGGHAAHLGEAVGVAGRDAGGGGVGGGGDDLVGEGAQLQRAAVGDVGVVVNRVELELRRGREAVFSFQVQTPLLAVGVEILGAVVPQEGGLLRGVLEIARGEKICDDVFAVEDIQGDAEITGPAEDIEDLLVREVEHGVGAVGLAQGNLLGERRGGASAEAVGGAAFFLQTERGAALEIDRAAEGVGPFVGRVAFHELELVEHRAAEIIEHGVARHAALTGEQSAIEGDGVEAGTHAADGEAGVGAGVVGIAGDPGEANRDLGGIQVGKITEGIGGDDVLEVVGVACGGDGGGIALAFAPDLEGVEFVDARGEIEIPRCGLVGGDGDSGALAIEAEVGDDEFVGAGGNGAEDVAAGFVREGGEAERGNLDAGALEQIAGAEIGDVARDGGGVGGGRDGERQENAGNKAQTGPF